MQGPPGAQVLQATSGPQRAVAGQKQKLSTWLGEQLPPGPQSASTRQFPPVVQLFAVQPVDEARQTQGWLSGHSESIEQVS
jgi:hypothetical protein